MIYVALVNKVDRDIVSFIAFAANLINIGGRQIYTIGNLKESSLGFFRKIMTIVT